MHAGNWEFPGGTLEQGETPEQCLKRELLEELVIDNKAGDLIGVSEHHYTHDWTIKLLAYQAVVAPGDFNLSDHDEIRWI